MSRLGLKKPADRHIGFLNYNRKLLTFGAVAASGVLMSLPVLPASAEVIYEEVAVTTLQSFATPAAAALVPVQRDAFDVTVFSLVQWPVPSATQMSSGFGYRSCSGCSADHKGIDLNPGGGYPIQAVADGVVVTSISSNAGLGVHVIIEHVIDGQAIRSLYAHMQFGSSSLKVGDTVARGQQVGNVGNTGSSTGAHLHFGILQNGVEIDPRAWLLAHANS